MPPLPSSHRHSAIMAPEWLLIVPVLAASAAAPPLAAGLVVGDCKGQAINVVAKPAAFKYSAVMDTAAGVVAACSAADSPVVWAPGDGRVAVNMSGQWWFSSGDRIQLGMKFNVTVLSPAVKHAASSSPPPPVLAQIGGIATVVFAAGAVAAAALLFRQF